MSDIPPHADQAARFDQHRGSACHRQHIGLPNCCARFSPEEFDELLLEAQSGPRFVEDRGHEFGSKLSDEEKRRAD